MATDVTAAPASVNYDDYTGFGRLNAGAALEMIERPYCNVLHFGTDTNPSTRTSEVTETAVTIRLTESFLSDDGLTTFDAGFYTADVHKVTATVTHTLPLNLGITHYWERHSSSTVADIYTTSSGQNNIRPVEQVKFTNPPTTSSATLEGYVYFLDNGTNSGWYPAAPEAAELTYSLIGCEATSTEEVVTDALELYPNPTSDYLSIVIPSDLSPHDEVFFYDFSGKLLFSDRIGAFNLRDNTLQVNIAQLPQGMYTCVIESKDITYSAKFVKL